MHIFIFKGFFPAFLKFYFVCVKAISLLFLGLYFFTLVYIFFNIGHFVFSLGLLNSHIGLISNQIDASATSITHSIYTQFLKKIFQKIFCANSAGLPIFHKFLMLTLSGDIESNPGPVQYNLENLLQEHQQILLPFRQKGLHFIHFNVNSILPKIEYLRRIAIITKPSIIGITESKLDSSIEDSEI